MEVLMVEQICGVLFTPPAPAIKMQFLRPLRAKFSITGGDEFVSTFCGHQFRFDARAQTITIHQQDFAHAVLTKHGTAAWKP
jgi:hypothetical protein